ncbi:MAG TPA: LptA/OstA family protein [Caulobacteraceae bacterium]
MIAPGIAAATVVIGACAPNAVRSQVDTRSNAPIDITADEAEVVSSKCVAIWRGSAEALQDNTRLRADTISVYSKPKGVGQNGQPACGGTDRVVADGRVYYVTPQQHVRGDHAVYSAATDEIVITGDVIVVQGKDVARGDRLTIKVSTREAKMESKVTGAGMPGRVRGVFYPEQNNQSPNPAKP